MDVKPDAYALIAQIVPVFLLIFAVRGSFLSSASTVDVQRRPKRGPWYRDPRIRWAILVTLFLAFEFLLVLGAAEVWMMPAMWVWVGLLLASLYAAIEFWLAGVVTPSPGEDE